MTGRIISFLNAFVSTLERLERISNEMLVDPRVNGFRVILNRLNQVEIQPQPESISPSETSSH